MLVFLRSILPHGYIFHKIGSGGGIAMKNDGLPRWITSLLLALILAGCNMPGWQQVVGASGPQSWVDAPLDGMHLPLAPYELVGHASDPGGISQIEFSVNGSLLATVPGAGGLFSARQAWSPAAPGEYRIQVRGMNSAGTWSEYAEVHVTVAEVIASATLEPTATLHRDPSGQRNAFHSDFRAHPNCKLPSGAGPAL